MDPRSDNGMPSPPTDEPRPASAGGDYDFSLRREAMAVLRHKTGVIVDSNAANRSALRTMLSAIGASASASQAVTRRVRVDGFITMLVPTRPGCRNGK